jgi:CDP-diacylglycerol---glycerol-3-phosphate 3-phosphatidyltransferase
MITQMFCLSNVLTLLRAPLAFTFLIESVPLRLSALFLAMVSDYMDGYIARKKQTTSQFGAILDPLMDKFFVFFALSVLLTEGKIELWQACAMISRDFFLCVFAIYLSLCRLWNNYKYKSIQWGKISTFLQFALLISLTIGYRFPNFVFVFFIITGSLAFIQLFKLRTS